MLQRKSQEMTIIHKEFKKIKRKKMKYLISTDEVLIYKENFI